MKYAKWILLFFIILGVAAASAVGVVYLRTEAYRNRRADVNIPDFPIDTSEALLARGKKLATTRGCRDCHGPDLGGQTFINDSFIGHFAGVNLTSGRGGRGAAYRTNSQWVAAIRFGLSPEGRPLMFMPSHEYSALSFKDTISIVAYLRSLPPVDRDPGVVRPGIGARALYLAGKFPMLFPAELVPASAQNWVTDVAVSSSPEYGGYVAKSCTGCHGDGFKGGKIHGTPPDWPPASDISGTGTVRNWTLEQFKNALRTGRTPEGKTLNPTYMPWPGLAQLDDIEIEGLFGYLKAQR